MSLKSVPMISTLENCLFIIGDLIENKTKEQLANFMGKPLAAGEEIIEQYKEAYGSFLEYQKEETKSGKKDLRKKYEQAVSILYELISDKSDEEIGVFVGRVGDPVDAGAEIRVDFEELVK